ncbi:hypothetical protein KFK09_001043 [Dendrobium nobile]|uniref:Uncharacterized protein n=1 Tax=Dendrobium nobile TaxID=94219 RepID=A0A8T3CES5_DENNO|nr:hypothetical protein KFK09_001043 [Dendrobium nobile]
MGSKFEGLPPETCLISMQLTDSESDVISLGFKGFEKSLEKTFRTGPLDLVT